MRIVIPAGLLARLEGARERMPSLMSDTLLAAATLARGRIAEKAPVNTGALRSSFVASLRPGPNPAGIVATPLVYAPVMEYGRTAGSRMPPVGPIALWAQRVLGLTEEEAQEVAWPMARAIARRGTKPRRFFRGGVKAALPLIRAAFRVAARRVLRG